MARNKKLPRINTAGGTPYKTKGANYWDNGSVAFRTKAEKEEIENIELDKLTSAIANQFKDHENNVMAFKRKML